MVNRSKAFIGILSVLIVLSAMLSACSGKGGKSESSSPAASSPSASSPAESAASPEKKDPVTLKVSWWGGDTRHAAFQDAIKLFEQKYDWIKVEPTFSGWDGYHDKLTVQLSTGEAPDLFLYSRNFALNYSKNDALVNLKDYQDGLPFLADMSSTLQPLEIDGKLYGMPAGTTKGIVIYNKRLFDEAKVAYPTDEETWLSLGEKWSQVHKANSKVYGGDGWFFSFDTFSLMMKQLGAEIVDASAVPAKATINVDKAKQIWGWTEKLWSEGTITRDSSDTISIEGGNLAVALGASSAVLSTVGLTQDPLGFAVEPHTFDGTGSKVTTPPMPPGLWGIPSASKHIPEAVMLLNFLLTDQDALKTIGVQIGTPAVPASLEYLSTQYQQGSVEYDMLDVVKRSQQNVDEYWLPSNLTPGYPEAVDAYSTEALDKYIFKKTNLDEFLAEAESVMNKAFQAAGK